MHCAHAQNYGKLKRGQASITSFSYNIYFECRLDLQNDKAIYYIYF